MIVEATRIVTLILLGMLAATIGVRSASGCAPHSMKAVRVQSAVTALAEVLDPSFALAMKGCAAVEERRERAELAREAADAQTAADTERHVATIREDCDDVRAAFLGMRTGLVMAEQALDDGKVEDAASRLEEVRSTWLQLKGGP